MSAYLPSNANGRLAIPTTLIVYDASPGAYEAFPANDAVIVTVPAALIVTAPSAATVATSSLLLLYVTAKVCGLLSVGAVNASPRFTLYSVVVYERPACCFVRLRLTN